MRLAEPTPGMSATAGVADHTRGRVCFPKNLADGGCIKMRPWGKSPQDSFLKTQCPRGVSLKECDLAWLDPRPAAQWFLPGRRSN